jgi:chemotaxis protein methyltransferase CheR
MVTFEHLNLVEEVGPSLATDTTAMDLIFCRNVLMYFSPAQMRKVIGKLHHSLLDGGWLAVSPCEASQASFPQFATQNFPGVILYQKREMEVGRAPDFQPAVSPISIRLGADPSWNAEPAGRPTVTPPPAPASPPPAAKQLRPTPEPPLFSGMARALADQGELAEALTWCDRWIAADKLDSAGHYLRAVVLLELGDPEQARRALQRTVYLHEDFVLAHFALGNLARRGGRNDEAARHFANTLHLLARLHPDMLLPESDGVTAARLTETITALTALEDAR